MSTFDIPWAEVKINWKWVAYNKENETQIKSQNPMNLEWRLNWDLVSKYSKDGSVTWKIVAVDDERNGLNLDKDGIKINVENNQWTAYAINNTWNIMNQKWVMENDLENNNWYIASNYAKSTWGYGEWDYWKTLDGYWESVSRYGEWDYWKTLDGYWESVSHYGEWDYWKKEWYHG